MAVKKPCCKCGALHYPMHMKDGILCKVCQKADSETLAQQLHALQIQTEQRCHQDRNEYGGTCLPEATSKRLEAIPSCKNFEEGQALAKKCVERNQVHFLAAWAHRKIRGRVTGFSLERDAKDAFELSRFLADKAEKIKSEPGYRPNGPQGKEVIKLLEDSETQAARGLELQTQAAKMMEERLTKKKD